MLRRSLQHRFFKGTPYDSLKVVCSVRMQINSQWVGSDVYVCLVVIICDDECRVECKRWDR